jgi:hypothetical protein
VYIVKFDNGRRAELSSGDRVVLLTPEVQAELDHMCPGWIGVWENDPPLFRVAATTGCHTNPVVARRPDRVIEGNRLIEPRASFPALDPVDRLVVGARVLAPVVDGPYLRIFYRGVVVSTPAHVLLADGRVLPATTRAAAIVQPDSLPSDGRFDVSADGTVWRRSKGGDVQLVGRGLVAPATLGELAARGESQALVDHGTRWQIVGLP